jgi:hypothetical protein
MALDHDIERLESGDAISQASTADEISRDSANHGYTSVYVCLVDMTPALTFCRIAVGGNEAWDYACVAKQARTYRDTLVKHGW